ncbi:asparagine synthase C-terminal domain-containing protein [Nocardia sp. NPDC050406]|uniref:asparagine synthase C-terminal domain-containing protein n=1 Tax=Nocardia sp. NPDC050406 TaxID=3364318 RepID=UPI003799CFFF
MTEQPSPSLAEQTGDAMQFVADVRNIDTPNPQRRQLADPVAAATLFKDETVSRIESILNAQSGTPVILLSGGVDSILVAAAAVKLGVRPHAITVIANGGTDRENAVAAADALGLTHEIIDLSEDTVVDLAREAVNRLGLPELWEVSYAIPLLATLPVLDRIGTTGPILTGSGADAIVGGGKVLGHPIDSPQAIEELDLIIRKESANNFVHDRLVPDFYPRVMGKYADQFVHVFQTLRFWEVAETFAPPALFGNRDGNPVDKFAVRIACEMLLPETSKNLAWAKKSAIQRSAGIMGTLATASRTFAASLPGAQTYSDPMTEPYEAVATRLFLALLDGTSQHQRYSTSGGEKAITETDPVTDFVAHYHLDIGGNWNSHRENWQQVALDAWLQAAQQRNLDATVLYLCEDSNQDVAIIEVGQNRYAITHLGRAAEVRAERR